MPKNLYKNGTDVGTLSKGLKPNFAISGKMGTHVMAFDNLREAHRWLEKNGWKSVN